MSDTYSIRPVSSSDLFTLGDFLFTSKLALTINRLLFTNWPDDTTQRPLYQVAVDSSFHDPSVECLKVVSDRSGDIVGYLALTRKRPLQAQRPTDAMNESAQQDVPHGFHPEVLSAVSTAVTEINQGIQGTDHFELTYICVKPLSRRLGIGSRLVQVCFDRAKAEGLPLGVCSEPAARDFFVQRGFRDTKHVDVDLRKWAAPYSGFGVFRLSGMIWSP